MDDVGQGALLVGKGVLGRTQEVGFALARGHARAVGKGRFDCRFGARKAHFATVQVLAEGGVDGGDMGACGEQGSGRGGWVRGGLAQHTEPHSDAGCFGHGLLPVVAHEIDRGRSDDPFGQEQTVGRAPARVGDLFK